jgi:hypothetical protein
MALVLSPALVLSAPTDPTGPNAPCIGWRNVVAAGGIEADSEAAGYPVTNLANPSTAAQAGWRSDSTDEQHITIILPGGGPVDYVGLARHNLGSTGVNLSIEAADPDNPGDWIEIFEAVVLAGDAPAVLRFDETFATAIRLRMIPVGAVPPRIAVVYAGMLLRLPRGLQPGLVPLAFAAADDVVSGQAESGDYLGRIVTNQSLKTAVSIRYLSYDWFRANMGPFARAARTIPFFFAWAPGDYPDDAGYAWLDGDIRPTVERTATGIVTHVDISMKALAL